MSYPDKIFLTIQEAADRLQLPMDQVFWFIEEEFLTAYVPPPSKYSIFIKEGVTPHILSRAKDSLKWYGVKCGQGSVLGFDQLEILNHSGETVYVVSGAGIRESCSYEHVRISSKELATFQALKRKQKIKKEFRQEPIKENPKSMDSLLKMVIAMAVKGYHYDPSAARSTTPAEIVSDAGSLDLVITEKTVREWLQKAASLVDQDKLKEAKLK